MFSQFSFGCSIKKIIRKNDCYDFIELQQQNEKKSNLSMRQVKFLLQQISLIIHSIMRVQLIQFYKCKDIMVMVEEKELNLNAQQE